MLLRLGRRSLSITTAATVVVVSRAGGRGYFFSTTIPSLSPKKRVKPVVSSSTSTSSSPLTTSTTIVGKEVETSLDPSKNVKRGRKKKEMVSVVESKKPSQEGRNVLSQTNKGVSHTIPTGKGKDGIEIKQMEELKKKESVNNEMVLPITINLVRVVEEWRAACRTEPLVETENKDIQEDSKHVVSSDNENINSKGTVSSSTRTSTTTTTTASTTTCTSTSTPTTLGSAVLGALLTRAVKLPDEYPMLHNILHVHQEKLQQQQQQEQGVIKALHAAEIVQNTEDFSVLLAFLRVYRTSAFNNTPVYERIMENLVQAMIIWYKELCTNSEAKHKHLQQHKQLETSMKMGLMLLGLEIRRNYFGLYTNTTSNSSSRENKKKPTKTRKTSSCDHKNWLEDITKRLLEEVAISVTNHITQEENKRELHSLTEAVVDVALLLLTSTMLNELPTYSSCVQDWESCIAQTQKAADAYLSNKLTEESLNGNLKNIRTHIFDLIDALRYLSIADSVIPQLLRDRLRRGVIDCLQRVCGKVGSRHELFTNILCTPEMVRRVQSLPSSDLCDAVQAAIFTGAALFYQCADDTAIDKLLQQLKVIKGVSKRDKGNIDNVTNRKMSDIDYNDDNDNDDDIVDGDNNNDNNSSSSSSSSNNNNIMKKLSINSRRTKVAFSLFSAGFDPEAVLSSGLCVGHNALEALELIHAASLFSRSFAFAPLPARLSTSLMTESAALIESRIRAGNRVTVTPTELLEEPKSLGDILAEQLELERNHVMNTKNGNNNNNNNKDVGSNNNSNKNRVRKGEKASLGMILHLTITTTIELLIRGEEKRLTTQLVRLLTLLEREGSYHYLVDGMALLIDGFVERFHIAGQYQNLRRGNILNSTSPEVERSLTEVTALFVPRVVEAVQRQLARTKRVSAMSDAEGEAAAELLQELLNFTVYIAACGMNATTAKQLVGLHTMIVKVLASVGKAGNVSSLAETVIRMNILVSHVGAKQRDFGVKRHPTSLGLRYCSIVLNDIVAAHLKPIAADIRRGSSIAVTEERLQVLSIVSLLFRLVSEHTVEAEPTELRAFRTDVLDPALTRVLQQQNNGTNQIDEALDLAALSEISVVMCVPHTIHHLSHQLLDQLAKAVTIVVPKEKKFITTEDQRQHSSKIAARLLVSAAAVCQLRQEKLTERYLTIVHVLGPLLLPGDISSVLWSFSTYHAPVNGEEVVSLRKLLAEEAASSNSILSVPQTMSSLQVLCELEDTSRFEYTKILRRIINLDHQMSPGEVGIIVRIATKLQLLGKSLPIEDLEFLFSIPTLLADIVLRMRQQCIASDVPLVLRGFSQISKERYGDLQERVMKAYILRTIQVCPFLDSKEVVECLESYSIARVSHQYLFGVLLARVAEVKLKFSLPLAVRLVMCGVNSTWDKTVHTACLTAAQPVFLGLVRHLLQSDPTSLPSVASNAVVVLQCLTEAFPNDHTSDLVLQNMAAHHNALSLSTMMAVLQLIEKRSTTEYSILRCFTEHAATTLFPQTSHKAFAELTRQFIQCGVRSRTLFDAVAKRFKEINNTCDSSVLATLADAFTTAHVDLEEDVINTHIKRTLILAEEEQNTFKFSYCISLLNFFALLDNRHTQEVTVLILKIAAKSLKENHTSHNRIFVPTITDINILLSASIKVLPPDHGSIANLCADALLEVIEEERHDNGESHRFVGSGWHTDLTLVVQLTNSMVQLGLANHAAAHHLFEVLYDKRSALMRRRLLLQSTTEAIQRAGENAHPQLFALLVEGKLLA